MGKTGLLTYEKDGKTYEGTMALIQYTRDRLDDISQELKETSNRLRQYEN